MAKLLLIVAAFLGVVAISIIERRLRAKATVGRKKLFEDEIYAERFQQMHYVKEDVIELLNEISTALDVHPGLLRPQDQFGMGIGGGLLLTPELDSLSEVATERAEKIGKKVDLQEIRTVLDYVDVFARKAVPQRLA